MPDIYPNQTGQIFAQNLGSIVDRFEKQQKEHQDRARLDQAYSTIAEQLGFDKNYLKTTSLEQKQGMVQGKQMAATLEGLRNQAAESQGRQLQQPAVLRQMQLHNQQLEYQEQQEAAQQRFQRDVGEYAPAGELPSYLSNDSYDRRALPEGQTAPGVMEFLRSGGRTGYNIPIGQLDDIGRAFGSFGGQGFEPTLKMQRVQRADGSWIEVPVGTTSRGGATWMQTLVPVEKPALSQAKPEVAEEQGVKFYRSGPHEPWKPLRADPNEALADIFSGGAAKPSPTKEPAATLEYRRNATTGEMEEYHATVR